MAQCSRRKGITHKPIENWVPFADTASPKPEILIRTDVISASSSFKYLGSVVDSVSDCSSNVNHRISVGWLRWQQNTPMFCDKKMPKKLKGKLYKTVVRPALTYGAKCWTFYDKHKQRLKTTEMKMLRMSLGVTRKDKHRYEYIRSELQVDEDIWQKVEESPGSASVQTTHTCWTIE